MAKLHKDAKSPKEARLELVLLNSGIKPTKNIRRNLHVFIFQVYFILFYFFEVMPTEKKN
jgi:hypothetical protein